jgi:tRNA dimethylallyltransferase
LEKLENPHARLQEVDPVCAERLHPNDRVRLIRALEVFEITGRPMSVVQKDPPLRKSLDAKIFWLDRENLREGIGQRIQSMMDAGYLAEVQGIIDGGWTLLEKPLMSFSYKFLVQYLQGNLSLEEALERTEIGTWHLARKQRIWNRNIGWPILSVGDARVEAFSWLESLD